MAYEAHTMSLFRIILAAGFLVLVGIANANDTKTLTIRGSSSESGDVIEVPSTASIAVETGADGIVVTLPGLDVRLRCLGDATANGYCYIVAGSGGGSAADSDGDNVPDQSDLCPKTPTNAALINNNGCPDTDGDGVFDGVDQCPNEGGAVGSDGCPTNTTTTYRVTPAAGTGGSISPSDVQTVSAGGTLTFTATASSGYQLSGFTGSCGGSRSGNQYTTAAVNSNCTVTATFSATTTGTGDYCTGTPSGLVGVVSCNANYNIDPWADGPSLGAVQVPALKILSIPFTTTDSATAEGHIQAYANTNTHEFTRDDNHRWHGWFSAVPGGPSLGDGCDWYALQPYDIKMQWEKSENDEYACNLGATSQVRYINFEARCFPERPDSPETCTDPTDRWNGVYKFQSTTQRYND